MKNLSTFQIVLLSFFALAIFIGVLIFSGTIPGFRSATTSTLGSVNLWGPVPETTMTPFLEAFNKANKNTVQLVYTYKPLTTLESDFVNALASGRGPDLIILPSEMSYREADKFVPVPYTTLALRDFKDTFVESGEVFLTPNGTLALPLLVDPLVMYYNRDIFSGEGIAEPPATWSAFRQVVKNINVIDNSGSIKRTALAFGEFSNNNNAKADLSLLFLQAGSNIISYDVNNGYRASLTNTGGGAISPGQAALDFFTQFADPSKDGYSWNRSLPEARDAFAAGILATYFGFGSELNAVKDKNPNLNFDIANVPQRDNGRKLTFARVYGIGVVKQTTNPNGAVQAALDLASKDSSNALGQLLGLPSARRDVLSGNFSNPYQAALAKAAVMSVSWLDPDALATQQIFSTAVSRVITGQQTAYDSITRANKELDQLLGH